MNAILVSTCTGVRMPPRWGLEIFVACYKHVAPLALGRSSTPGVTRAPVTGQGRGDEVKTSYHAAVDFPPLMKRHSSPD